MKKPILLLDMDDTLADFGSGCTEEEKTEYAPESMWRDNFFMRLKPMAGAIGAVKKLWDSGLFDIYICSVPVAGLHESYSDKSAWVSRYFPYLYDRIILCQDKSLLEYDYIIDDNEKWREHAKTKGINPKVRKANQRYHWHKIAEDLIDEVKTDVDFKEIMIKKVINLKREKKKW